METFNNAHWFIFATSIFISFWIGVILTNIEYKAPESGFQIIIGFIGNAVLIIAMFYNLFRIVQPLL